MPRLGWQLAEGTAQLQRAGVAAPRLTAEVLLAHLLGQERSYLYAHPEEELAPNLAPRWHAALAARSAGVPLQYLTGLQEFYGRPFHVSPAVLIPRPETELVVTTALELLRERGEARVLDVGTGSGCIAVTLALERPQARVLASDISAGALAVAADNARRLGAAVALVQADLTASLSGPFDLIVSNPPYVAELELQALAVEVREHEPRRALVAGAAGTEIYDRLIPQAQALLRPRGWLVLELGYATAGAVRWLLGAPWRQIGTRRDTQGWERVLTAQRR
ncbi:MAG: peptide chain release factor N(5)-glutamine methyltransferase [Terriglobales bacterium]